MRPSRFSRGLIVSALGATVGLAEMACGKSPTTPSPTTPTPPTVTTSGAVPTIFPAEVYPGEPNPDPDYCFAGCPNDVIVPRDSDGGFTLKSGAQYSVVIYIGISPAGCISAYEVSDTWDSRSKRGSSLCDFDRYVGTEVVYGLLTPSSTALGSLASDQRIIAVVETHSATARVEIPIRFAR